MFRCFSGGEARFLRRCFVRRKSFSLLGNGEGDCVTDFHFWIQKRLSGITVTGGFPCSCAEMEFSALAVDFDVAALLAWMR